MTIWLLLALLTTGPESPAVTTDHFAQIELNHFFDENGRHVFDQLIFREWRGDELQIADWRLIKHCNQFPTSNRIIYHDGQTLRRITTTSTITTWTQHDPELVERATLPKEQRRELTSPRITKQRAQELINHGQRMVH